MGLQLKGQNGEGALKHSTTTCCPALIHLTYVAGVNGRMELVLVMSSSRTKNTYWLLWSLLFRTHSSLDLDINSLDWETLD